ncbi:chaplin [Streptomyces sp. NPDC090025]|uniref:chaplin n=1 Tax=Streptomyces sp. NPDC090025 TaxID=3365922 RepID=UPI0038336BBA
MRIRTAIVAVAIAAGGVLGATGPALAAPATATATTTAAVALVPTDDPPIDIDIPGIHIPIRICTPVPVLGTVCLDP